MVMLKKALAMLFAIIADMVAGNSISIVSSNLEGSTQQGAEILNISWLM